MASKHLGPTGLKGLKKLALVMAPGEQHSPFVGLNQLSLAHHLDRSLDYFSPQDLAGVQMLLPLLAYMPTLAIVAILRIAEKHQEFPDFLGTHLRTLQIGLKGLVFTLYYSNLDGGKMYRELSYDAKINSNSHHHTPNNKNQLQDLQTNRKQIELEIQTLSLAQRLRLISHLKNVILEQQEKIIDRIVSETHKARLDVLSSEIFPLLEHLSFLEKKAKHFLSDHSVPTPLALLGKKSVVQYQGLGTILVISPWNYPFYQAIVPITTSFVCGNATWYKPSELTPLTGLVEEILSMAGFNPRWVKVCYGDGQTGQEMIALGPNKIFFTGSVATGKKIMKMAADQLIPVELELGGKDPMIVLPGANLDRTVAGALWGAMTNTGQSCTSVELLYVHQSQYEEFKNLLLQKINLMTLGSQRDSDMGPMISAKQVEIIAKQIEEFEKNGGKILTPKKWDKHSKSIPPLVLDNPPRHLSLVTEETFGPILPLFVYTDIQQVVDEVNQSAYGLSASIWGDKVQDCLKVARQLKTGNVSINNVMLTEGNHHLPFGGVKNSGMGRYKGRWGLESFSNIKAIIVDSNSSKIEANWYPYTSAKYQLFSSMMQNYFRLGVTSFTAISSIIKFAYYGLSLEMLAGKLWKKTEWHENREKGQVS